MNASASAVAVAVASLVLWVGSITSAEPTRTEEPADPKSEVEAPQAEGAEDPQAKLEEMEQRLKILERKQELAEEAAADKAKQTVQVTAGKDGFSIRSADGQHRLRLRGLIQTDAAAFSGDDERPISDTAQVRRVRPIFEGTLAGRYDFRLTPDFGAGTTVLQDAYMDVRFARWLRVRGGKAKTPFGLERLQSASDTLFVLRALPTNLVPNRDIGLMLQGEPDDGLFSFALGYFNGVADGASSDSDNGDGKDVAARFFVHPFRRSHSRALRDFGIGVAGTYGRNVGELQATGLAGYRTANPRSFFSYRTGATVAETVLANGRRARLSPQAYWYAGRFGVMAEYVVASHDVRLGSERETLRHDSSQVSVSLALTHDSPTYKSITPHRPLEIGVQGKGAVELKARWGRLAVDDETFPVFADPQASARKATELVAGVNWILSRNAKVMFDWSRVGFDGGSATGDREVERAVLSRLQVAF